MDNFHDLEKSSVLEDQMIHYFFVKLLDMLFGKHDDIMINLECETEKNQQLITDQGKILGIYFGVSKRVISTQKCVRQTLKHMVDHLNNKYQFKQPIQFITRRETIREGSKVFAKNYTTFDLV